MPDDRVLSGPAVSVTNLTKRFGDFTAVDDIGFDVCRGEVFGFLGPNGAGKSTTIRMLCGIIKPTSGEGVVGGYSIRKDSDRIKLNTGYMSQKFSLYRDLTPYENLEFYSGVYGLPGNRRRERISWALDMAGLTNRKDDQTGDLPVGFQQRLALGAAVLHEPSILFLDEPTAGVDPLSRRSFWDLIHKLSSSGVTVFVTTHYMDEAEHCDRIAFIDKGKLIKLNSPSALKKEEGMERVYELVTDNWRTAFDLLRKKRDRFGAISLFGTNIHLNLQPEKLAAVTSYLKSEGVEFSPINEIAPSLEDIFVSLLRSDDETGDRT
ncbi:MAG: ABC transporter ATP-binding protein [candidate division Zixibacteria bacterium]